MRLWILFLILLPCTEAVHFRAKTWNLDPWGRWSPRKHRVPEGQQDPLTVSLKRSSGRSALTIIRPQSLGESGSLGSEEDISHPIILGGDADPRCCYWAQKGQCSLSGNPYWMRPHCQKSCGTFGCTIEGAEACFVRVATKGCPWQLSEEERETTPIPSAGEDGFPFPPIFTLLPSLRNVTLPPVPQRDPRRRIGIRNRPSSGFRQSKRRRRRSRKDRHPRCCEWAAKGECNANPIFMRTRCRTSCGTAATCTILNAVSCEVSLNITSCTTQSPVQKPPAGFRRSREGTLRSLVKQERVKEEILPNTEQEPGTDVTSLCCYWAARDSFISLFKQGKLDMTHSDYFIDYARLTSKHMQNLGVLEVDQLTAFFKSFPQETPSLDSVVIFRKALGIWFYLLCSLALLLFVSSAAQRYFKPNKYMSILANFNRAADMWVWIGITIFLSVLSNYVCLALTNRDLKMQPIRDIESLKSGLREGTYRLVDRGPQLYRQFLRKADRLWPA